MGSISILLGKMALDFQSIHKETNLLLNPEEKNNGRPGLKISMIGQTNKHKVHKLDFHINLLFNQRIFKSPIHLLKLNQQLKIYSIQKMIKSGNNGLKIWFKNKIKKLVKQKNKLWTNRIFKSIQVLRDSVLQVNTDLDYLHIQTITCHYLNQEVKNNGRHGLKI